jgi:hypothetical protein
VPVRERQEVQEVLFGHQWGERERSKGQHPLFGWLQKTQAYSRHKPGEPKVKTIVMMGFIACWLHLAYALYLIAHHDEILGNGFDSRRERQDRVSWQIAHRHSQT